MNEIHYESLFVDSGAFGLFNRLVLKRGAEKTGLHGRVLEKADVGWGQGDFSAYDLRKGTEFRKYCDDYANFIKRMVGKDVLFANVDAISNPALTWEIQQFFEKEHGVTPVPVIHSRTPMGYVDRYLETGKHQLLGVGGLGHSTWESYIGWADSLYTHICPESNKYLPVVRTHGFAMTSWKLLCRYPWWSVDSATWVKLSAYGWLYLPRWSEDKGWRFDMPPMQINFSHRSPMQRKRDKHYLNLTKSIKIVVDKWLEKLGLDMGSVDGDGEVDEFGVSSHHRARNIANLTYLKDLEESRPEWPHPLDEKIIQGATVRYSKGFGL